MKIYNKSGSKQRLFEMMSRVNKVTLNESGIPKGRIVSIKDITPEKIGIEFILQTSSDGKTYKVSLNKEYFPSPDNPMEYTQISTEMDFDNWVKKFTKKFGDDGYLVNGLESSNTWGVKGNEKYLNWKDEKSGNIVADKEMDNSIDEIDDYSNNSLPTKPEEDDCIISSNGWELSVSCGGKFIGKFDEDDKAFAAVREWKKRNNFYPNTWFISDHGNVFLVDDNGNIIRESINSDTTHDPNKTNIRDSKGNIPKVGDIIVYENGDIGKILSVDNDTMEVDFRSHYLTLNTKSEFEIIKNPSEKIKRAFNIDESNAKLAKIKSSNPALYNQLMVAKKTMKMSDAMAGVMGGMSKEEARQLLLKHGILKETININSSIDGDYTKDNENHKKAIVGDLKYTGHKINNNDSLDKLEKKDGLFSENLDSVVDYDRAYLDNSVNTEDTNISKYDGGLDYPENPLRIDSELLHNEPLFEMDDFKPLTLNYDQKGNWIPAGHEDKRIALRTTYHPIGSDNEKILIVKIFPEGSVDKIYKVMDDWEKAKEELKKYL